MLNKIASARRIIDEKGLDIELEVDGGVKASNAVDVVKAGGRVLVAGSAIFSKTASIPEAMNRIRESIGAND